MWGGPAVSPMGSATGLEAPGRIRTCDIDHDGMAILYQLSYRSAGGGGIEPPRGALSMHCANPRFSVDGSRPLGDPGGVRTRFSDSIAGQDVFKDQIIKRILQRFNIKSQIDHTWQGYLRGEINYSITVVYAFCGI